MITPKGEVINGIWNYGVQDENQMKKKGFIDSIINGTNKISR